MKLTYGLVLAGCTLVLSLTGCTRTEESQTAGNIDLASASRYFMEMETLCVDRGADLWGVSLCGPIVLVDPGTRQIVGNQRDPGGTLQKTGNVYVGELPEDVGIANTAFDWNGERWTMIIWWSLSEDPSRRMRLMAHESFHRVQPELGLEAFGDVNAHLDTADGRFWMQMEWNALQQALLAEGESRQQALADALAFRAARRAAFPEAAAREIPLEIFEGLAEYTGMRFAGFSDREVVDSVAATRADDTGFVRSFAYVSGPLYGYLLDHSGVDWRPLMHPTADLGAVLAEAQGLTGGANEAASRVAQYGGAELRAVEAERERARQERLDAWRALLIDGPVLIMDLSRVSSGTFDPRRVYPFGEHQTIYTVRGLIAEWGAMNVDGGAILEDDGTGRAHVSLVGASPDRFSGDGWTLELNAGWGVAPAGRAGDFIVRRD